MLSHSKDDFGNLVLWKSYEYINPVQGDRFHQAHYEKNGGPEGKPFIWADDTMWSIDTPENPHSILVLLHYRNWDPANGFLDLRNAEIEFCLRGDDLKLHHAACFFWVCSVATVATRWHYTHCPLEITDGCWSTPFRITLQNDSCLWHRSFSDDPSNPGSLDETLGAVFSYGFSFVGFSQKVSGRFSMGAFLVKPHIDARKAFVGYSPSVTSGWQTVSDAHKKQIPIAYNHGCRKTKGAFLTVDNDYIVIHKGLPFAYLAFAGSDQTHGMDLRNARIIVEQFSSGFDIKGGSICFFVENASTSTIWIFRNRVPMEASWTLLCDEQCWYRVTGSASLESVLAGDSGASGYEYFGFMAVEVTDRPSGCWGLNYFSIMPDE